MAQVANLPIGQARVDVEVIEGDLVLSAFDGRTRYVRPYWVRMHNRTDHRIKLMGRRLKIVSDGVNELVPFTRSTYAPSVGGEQPILEPGEPWSFSGAVVTDSPHPPGLEGSFDAIDPDAKARFIIKLPFFSFKQASSPSERIDGAARLVRDDAEVLCDAIERYEFSRGFEYGALLQVDNLSLTQAGHLIVNRFLVDFFRVNRNKDIKIDFRPLLPDTYSNRLTNIVVKDHYFEASSRPENRLVVSYVLSYNAWVKRGKPADAGLSLIVRGARERYGFHSVMKELLGTASPEECALVPGMVLAVQRELTGVEKPRRLSEADAAEFRAFLSKQPWTEARGLSPSDFIATVCKRWLDRGLALSDVRTAQPNLASAYSAEVSRHPENRLENLYVKPYRLPAGTPARPRATPRIEDLSDDKKAIRRERDRLRIREARAKRRLAGPT